MWRDLDPAHRRNIIKIGSAAAVVVAALVLWLNPQWLQPKPPPPDYSAFLGVQEPRELLIEKFSSYDNTEKVTRQLTKDGFQWRIERLHVKCADECPPFKMDTLIVPNYRHLNLEGKLTLEFFNDRLSNTVFNPVDPETYLQRLKWSGVKLRKIKVSRWEQRAGNLRVATNIIYATSNVGRTLGTQPYASWEDMRLVDQTQGWYEQFGNKTTLTPIESSDPGSE